MNNSKRVLVIDDTRLIRAMAEAMLRAAGYDVRGAASGEEAESIWNEWPPHVVLLDLVLDEEDGWNVLERLQRSPARSATVFICTGDDDVEDREAVEHGAAGVIRKPFTPDTLTARVGEAVGTQV